MSSSFHFCRALFTAALFAFALRVSAEWATFRAGADHTGFVEAELTPPFRLAWACEFLNERLGTAAEPVAGGNNVFIATHSGNLYALRSDSGEPAWRFHAGGPFLNSPAAGQDVVVCANANGCVYALRQETGEPAWTRFVSRHGFAASPLIAAGRIIVASRTGEVVCLDLLDGREHWRRQVAPIRQTPAFAVGRVFVTAEDLRVRAFDFENGKEAWRSEPLEGQTARDYYPVVVEREGRSFVLIRTNPLLNMGQRIARDRTLLCRNAGVDDSGWQKIESWIRSDTARGTPELWRKEQRAIINYLETNRDARTFFVLDAATGREAAIAPILWAAGCQGVGSPPARTRDGRMLVFYRSAYGNWSHGVAPLVSLGLYDLANNQITPLFHQQGAKPAWNCFWGTADESQNFLVAGETVIIVHQGTLSGFDLRRNELFPIYGERDTFGGFRSPSWARNEWHGPGRAGIAVVGKRIYWQAGSRLLCLAAGERGRAAAIATISARSVKASQTEAAPLIGRSELGNELSDVVTQILAQPWAPLFVDPGLSGRDFSFDDSSRLFEALSWAYPHVSPAHQSRIRATLAEQWTNHPPFTSKSSYPLKEGMPREWFALPVDFRARLGADRQPHPFGGVYATRAYAERCREGDRVKVAFPEIRKCFEAFEQTKWKLDPAKGDLFANRYLASLLAYSQLAAQAGDQEGAARARETALKTTDALVAWWRRAGGTLTNFNGSAQLDPFINGGDAISLRIAPHRHKIGLFHDLTPEVAALVREQAPDAVARTWSIFEHLYATWYCVGEERQVHFGENFVDPPDLAMNGFKALAWLRGATSDDLAAKVDIPFCRADLYRAMKLAMALEREGERLRDGQPAK